MPVFSSDLSNFIFLYKKQIIDKKYITKYNIIIIINIIVNIIVKNSILSLLFISSNVVEFWWEQLNNFIY